ncbi:hypothetical protein PLESTB_000147100 [Pleodorina starrii]|uniref:Uncharacterized protein n=1 Tax=Pleodorina starrii TaxID=330485 RepID=A0A9W6EXC2_9CHLO|nr:hypothetical protein PLESTM_000445700 [Pleodorina starrii]GLC48778.1 hypothetical protein PLESTB_000147100 [Pleodorina starrii]GLC72519.1 hypothetical protein PLESTF_001259900 [Pleodorina starrii]
MTLNMAKELRELEALRQALEEPKRTFSPLKTLKEIATPRAGLDVMKTYSTALNSAEKSVDRLGRAIEAAEEEMDAALKRTTEIHRSQLKQKELEILELQRVIGAKERSVDSLRDTLATTKRTYESKLSQTESALTLKDAEIKALAEELRVVRLEKESLGMQLERSETGRRALEADVREREAELGAEMRVKADEAAKSLLALRYEKKEKEDWRQQSDDLRRQVQVLQEELHASKEDLSVMKDRYEAEFAETRRRCVIDVDEARRRCEAEVDEFRRRCEAELEDIKRRLRSEKNLRKACEKWLRSELKSREEMELLLAAVKDAASGRAAAAGEAAAEVELLIDRLRIGSASPPPLSPAISPRGGKSGSGKLTANRPSSPPPAGLATTTARTMELELLRRKLEEDNNRLKTELTAARRMLTDKLKY